MDEVIFKSSMLMCQTVQKVQIMWNNVFLNEKINQQDLGVEPTVLAAQVVVLRSVEDTHPS